jgi:hypothetical protein
MIVSLLVRTNGGVGRRSTTGGIDDIVAGTYVGVGKGVTTTAATGVKVCGRVVGGRVVGGKNKKAGTVLGVSVVGLADVGWLVGWLVRT